MTTRRSLLCVNDNFMLAGFTFIAHPGFATQMLATMLDSLVRVSRRVVWGHFANRVSAGGGWVSECLAGQLPVQPVPCARQSPPLPPLAVALRAAVPVYKECLHTPPSHHASPRSPTAIGSGTAPVQCLDTPPAHAPNTDPNRFPFNNFTHCLTPFSRCFSSFPHGTCSLSVSCLYLALDEIYHPF